MTETTAFDWATDLTTDWTEGVPKFPFVEDENANITGYGHQDKATFAAELNRYDAVTSGDELPEDEIGWTADDIAHNWVVPNDDNETLRVVTSTTVCAIPVTTLWGAR